ncbi:uncharacterized protein LOC142331477 [Lycorma delicatula]|uniref:uncharacterized protein LOC142331477 n=1 Tax=Lycorma delicatula TaxID=130591 RepID=UPI003F518528
MVSTKKINCYLLICTWWACRISGAPIRPPNMQENTQMIVDKATGRVFPSMFSGILDSLPFIPLNINVPDALNGMYSIVTQYFGGSTPRDPNKKKKKKKPNTTTTTAKPIKTSLELEEDESKRLDNQQSFEEVFQEYIRKKDEFGQKKKKKHRKKKHQEEEILTKIASHLAYLELDC